MRYNKRMTLQPHFSDDGGHREIDWGRTSSDYAEHRPDYPAEFYDRLSKRGIGVPGQRILDLGTGVGFLAHNFARRGAEVTGIDIAAGQIEVAKQRAVADGLTIDYQVVSAEETGLSDGAFDCITASQCWLYFDKAKATAEMHRLLRPEGLLMHSHFCWLPREDEIAYRSEQLALKYNPDWTGADWSGEIPSSLPVALEGWFESVELMVFDAQIPFTHTSWRGRWRACRGIGASLTPAEIEQFDREHADLLDSTVEANFTVKHRIDCHIFLRL